MRSTLVIRLATLATMTALGCGIAHAAERRPDRTDGPAAAHSDERGGDLHGPGPGGPPPGMGRRGMGGPGMGGPGMRGPGMGGPGGPPGPRPEDLEALGLPDAQRTNFDSLRDTELRRVIPLQADIQLAELDLERTLSADRPDGRKVDELADRLSALRAQVFKAHLATRVAFQSMLTPEQRKQLRSGPRR